MREAQATEELTATAAMLVELKARAAQGQAESAKHKQEVQALRQEYRTMAVNLDDKVSELCQGTVREGLRMQTVLSYHGKGSHIDQEGLLQLQGFAGVLPEPCCIHAAADAGLKPRR